MNEEQFNRFEELARQAALQEDHPFDESSWRKMEALLDKEKDRRRFVPWWWISLAGLLFLSGLFWFYGQKATGDRHDAKLSAGAASEMPATTTASGSDAASDEGSGAQTEPKGRISSESTGKTGQEDPAYQTAANSAESKATGQKETNKQSYPGTFSDRSVARVTSDDPGQQSGINEKKATRKIRKKNSAARSAVNMQSPMATEQPGDKNMVESAEPADKEKQAVARIISQVQDHVQPDTREDVKSPSAQQLPDSSAGKPETKPLQPDIPTVSANKQSKKTTRGFYVLGGIGADFSSVRLFSFRNSPVAPRFGAGLGYQISKRWSVQTGFYASSKRYVAGPGDYKTGTGGYWSNISIVSVDANCLVYEIPLQVRYNVFEKGSYGFYATAGISSYLMQKETYDYTLLRTGSYYPYQVAYSYSGNRHPFSVVSLSAGMQRMLGKKTGLLIEPYVQLPMGGVGEGGVRLYSFGIQTAVRYDLHRSGKKQKK